MKIFILTSLLLSSLSDNYIVNDIIFNYEYSAEQNGGQYISSGSEFYCRMPILSNDKIILFITSHLNCFNIGFSFFNEEPSDTQVINGITKLS